MSAVGSRSAPGARDYVHGRVRGPRWHHSPSAAVDVVAGRIRVVTAVGSPPSFKGQRSYPGLWWMATTRSHVAFQSWLQRDRLIILDFDPSVVAVASRSLCLEWTSEVGAHRCVPDYFARCADRTADPCRRACWGLEGSHCRSGDDGRRRSSGLDLPSCRSTRAYADCEPALACRLSTPTMLGSFSHPRDLREIRYPSLPGGRHRRTR